MLSLILSDISNQFLSYVAFSKLVSFAKNVHGSNTNHSLSQNEINKTGIVSS